MDLVGCGQQYQSNRQSILEAVQIMKELELSKKLAVLGKIYRMSLISEEEYLLVKAKILNEYNIVSLSEK